jgi:MFS family permease
MTRRPASALDRWFGSLRIRNFRLFFIGQTTSQIGTGMAPVAIAFAVLAQGTATDVGYVLAAGTVPLVLCLLVGGVVADRVGRRRVMLTSDALRAASQGALGAWIVLGHPPLWGFILLTALSGVGQAFFSPAMTGLLPEILEAGHLQQGNVLNGLTESVGGIIGPAVAGVIVATSNPGWAVLIDGLTFLVSAVSLAMVRITVETPSPTDAFLVLLRQGWDEFWSRTWLWVIVVEFSLVNAIIFAPYLVLGPVVAKEYLGGARAWGLVLASLGAGAVVGGVIMLRVQPRHPLRMAVVSTFVWVAPLLALAVHAPTGVLALSSLLGGASVPVFMSLWNTTMQREIPSDLLSRVSAYDWFGSLLFLPVGMVIVGPLSTAVGPTPVLVTAAILTAALTGVVLCVPSVTHLRAPAPVGTGPDPDL